MAVARTLDPIALTAGLRKSGAQLARGLTDAELDLAETMLDFTFPPDHRLLLSIGVPIGTGWPPWHDPHNPALRERLEWPTESIAWEVEHSDAWFLDWGGRPDDPQEAASVARAKLATVPKLAPLYGHRYLPTAPSEAGNPVLSCYQTDVIYYGTNLLNWFECEFGQPRAQVPGRVERRLPFWSSLVEWE